MKTLLKQWYQCRIGKKERFWSGINEKTMEKGGYREFTSPTTPALRPPLLEKRRRGI